MKSVISILFSRAVYFVGVNTEKPLKHATRLLKSADCLAVYYNRDIRFSQRQTNVLVQITGKTYFNCQCPCLMFSFLVSCPGVSRQFLTSRPPCEQPGLLHVLNESYRALCSMSKIKIEVLFSFVSCPHSCLGRRWTAITGMHERRELILFCARVFSPIWDLIGLAEFIRDSDHHAGALTHQSRARIRQEFNWIKVF